MGQKHGKIWTLNNVLNQYPQCSNLQVIITVGGSAEPGTITIDNGNVTTSPSEIPGLSVDGNTIQWDASNYRYHDRVLHMTITANGNQIYDKNVSPGIHSLEVNTDCSSVKLEHGIPPTGNKAGWSWLWWMFAIAVIAVFVIVICAGVQNGWWRSSTTVITTPGIASGTVTTTSTATSTYTAPPVTLARLSPVAV